MASFEKGLKLVYEVEYNNNPKKALIQVKGEDFITYKGINRKAWSKWNGWIIIDQYIKECGSLKFASPICDTDPILEEMVKEFYRINFWNVNSLDKITQQHIADEIFVTGVLVNPKIAAKFAQRVVGVVDDGAIGPNTLKALNTFDASLFDKQYDEQEIKYYHSLAANPKFSIYKKGWENRAAAI